MNTELINKIYKQVESCRNKYGDYSGRHEAYGVLSEEVFELQQEIFKKQVDFEKLEAEIIDIITVLIKMHEDIVIKRKNR